MTADAGNGLVGPGFQTSDAVAVVVVVASVSRVMIKNMELSERMISIPK